MNYWLTTHWPRQQGTPTSEPYADVWVKDGQWDVVKQLAPEDLVFIYESRSGPLPLGHNPDGSTYKRPKAQGKKGIVALVNVKEPAQQPPDSVPAQYDNGQKMWWRFGHQLNLLIPEGSFRGQNFSRLSARSRHITFADSEKTIRV